MLGSIKSPLAWKWAAFGKHPVANDYFYTGTDDPLFKAFSGWVENGYRQVCAGKKAEPDLYAWRFYAKGPQQDTLLCGIGRDSYDRIGRPYPLVIMGVGPLSEWSRHFDLLPFALEIPWYRMEYMAAKRYMDFSGLEEDTRRLPSPNGRWAEYDMEKQRRLETLGPEAPAQDTIRETLRQKKGAVEMILPLSDNACRDITTSAALRFSMMMPEEKTIPGAVFLGGVVTQTFMAVFRRPLGANDFARLWSAGAGKKEEES